jgi:hypothetical protein
MPNFTESLLIEGGHGGKQSSMIFGGFPAWQKKPSDFCFLGSAFYRHFMMLISPGRRLSFSASWVHHKRAKVSR